MNNSGKDEWSFINQFVIVCSTSQCLTLVSQAQEVLCDKQAKFTHPQEV